MRPMTAYTYTLTTFTDYDGIQVVAAEDFGPKHRGTFHYSWYSGAKRRTLLSLKAQKNLFLDTEEWTKAYITGISVLDIDVFAVYIHTMKEQLLSMMNINTEDILWVLTVPKIWLDFVRELIRCLKKSGKKAGIDDLPIRILCKPGEATFSCQHFFIDNRRGTSSYGFIKQEDVKYLFGDHEDTVNSMQHLIEKMEHLEKLRLWLNPLNKDTYYLMSVRYMIKKMELMEKLRVHLTPFNQDYRLQRLIKQMKNVEQLKLRLDPLDQDADNRMQRLIKEMENVVIPMRCLDPLHQDADSRMLRTIKGMENVVIPRIWLNSLDQDYRLQSWIKMMVNVEKLTLSLDPMVQDNRLQCFIEMMYNMERLERRLDRLNQDADYCMQQLLKEMESVAISMLYLDPLHQDAHDHYDSMLRLLKEMERMIILFLDTEHQDVDCLLLCTIINMKNDVKRVPWIWFTPLDQGYRMQRLIKKMEMERRWLDPLDHDYHSQRVIKRMETIGKLRRSLYFMNQANVMLHSTGLAYLLTKNRKRHEISNRKKNTYGHGFLQLQTALELQRYCEKDRMIVVDEIITSEKSTFWNGFFLIVQIKNKLKMKRENTSSGKDCFRHEQLDKRQPNALRIERRG